MSKVVWEDSDLDGRVVGVLKECGAVSDSTAMAPNTVFRRLKAPEVVLGITRVKESLHRLSESHTVKKTGAGKPRYFLRKQ
jgi:hypothetical protein